MKFNTEKNKQSLKFFRASQILKRFRPLRIWFSSRNYKIIFKKIIIGFVILAVVFVFDFWLFSPKEFSSQPTPEQEPIEQDYQEPSSVETPPIEDIPEIPEPEQEVIEHDFSLELKESVDLSVPFAVQAPFAEWDELHKEACEEAVLIIANAWLDGEELTKEQVDEQILASVKWQQDNWGGHYDLNVSETIRLANQYFGIEKIYITNVDSIDNVKYELSKGNIVIVPTAGRLLENPYYRQPGPSYHMLVVKGYNEKEIITNDPGTKRGADFTYSYDNFFQAIHDWPFSLDEIKFLSDDEKAEEVMLQGEKIMIVVEKE